MIAIAADERSATRGLEISFRGQRMTRICVTKVIIWNSGNLAIRKEDIPPSQPIRVTARDDCSILDAEVLQTNNANAGVTCEFVDGNALITFDYLAPQVGFVLNIAHTGKGGDSLKLDASFIDSSRLRRVPVFEASMLRRAYVKRTPKHIRTFRYALLWSAIIVGFLPWVGLYFDPSSRSLGSAVPAAVLTVLYWGIAGGMFYFRIPDGLESYFE